MEDASLQCYAVLDGISPAYPPAMGRLHTCYSPVRRSPAVKSKLSTPLPLDLHVLSLSLAFILSQDQTLRCFFYLVSFSSSLEQKARLFVSVCLKQHPKRDTAPPMNRYYCVQLSKLTESKILFLLLYYFRLL